MHRISIPFMAALIVISGCRNAGRDQKVDLIKSGVSEAEHTGNDLSLKYHDQLQGLWTWQPSDRYQLSFKNGKAVFLTGGQPDFKIVGRVERDSASWTVSRTNCNERAPYYELARHLIHGEMYFLSFLTPISRDRIKRRCFAIIELGEDRLKLIDTDNGTILDYKR